MLVIKDFYGPNCHACKMLEPVLDELKEQYGFEVIKINLAEDEREARELGIMSLPTLVIYKDGEEVERVVGFSNKDKLEQIIKKL